MSTDNLLRKLLHSDEPLVRFKAITTLYSGSNNIILQQELRNLATRSPLVTALLFECDKSGVPPFKPYTKWYGSHWILAVLADMCCPPGDQRLRPLQDQSLRWLFPDDPPRALIVNGRVRRCASIDGNALYYSLKLGLGAELNTRLEERLLDWQWPDGGWNCDRRPEASNSSFMESLIPMRALALYVRESGDESARVGRFLAISSTCTAVAMVITAQRHDVDRHGAYRPPFPTGGIMLLSFPTST